MNNKIIELLNELENKLIVLENNGFDIAEYKDKIDFYKRKSDNIINNSNSSQTQTLTDITNEIYVLETKINNIYESNKIFIDIDILESHLNYDITKEKLDKINLIIINDLSYYLSHRLIYKSSKEKELIEKLYNHIKFEYRINYSSFIFEKLLSLKFGLDVLYDLMQKDILKYMDQKDIYKRYNEYIDLEHIDKKMLYLISLNEDGYKDKVLSEIKEIQDKSSKIKKEYEDYKKIAELKPARINQNRSKIYKNIRLLLLNVIPKILSLTILINANVGINKDSKETRTYKTTYEICDQYNNESTATIYDNAQMNDVFIRVYHENEENEKGNLKVTDKETNSTITYDSERSVDIYRVENDGRSINEYLDIDLENLSPIQTTTEVNDEINSITTDEYINVYIPTEIDTNDYHQDYLIMNHIKTTFFIMVADFFISAALCNIKGLEESGGGLTPVIFYFGTFISDIEKYIKNIQDSIKDLKIKEGNKEFNKKKLKELKEEYIKTKKEYDILIQKYDKLEQLLEYNGIEKKLK